MKKSRRPSPRLEPQIVHRYFCTLLKQEPGQLKLSAEPGCYGGNKEFNALVGQFFVVPMRAAFFGRPKNHPETTPIAEYLALTYGKLTKAASKWHEIIDKYWQDEKEGSAKGRIYAKRSRRSISDNLWNVLARLYWNHAAWIILRGEYKAMRKTTKTGGALSDTACERELRKRYGYLPQVQRDGWFAEVKKGSPRDLALRDTAESLKLTEGSLKLMLSPGRLSKSPPGSLIRATMDTMDPMKSLARLERIPPSTRKPNEKMLIRMIKSKT